MDDHEPRIHSSPYDESQPTLVVPSWVFEICLFMRTEFSGLLPILPGCLGLGVLATGVSRFDARLIIGGLALSVAGAAVVWFCEVVTTRCERCGDKLSRARSLIHHGLVLRETYFCAQCRSSAGPQSGPTQGDQLPAISRIISCLESDFPAEITPGFSLDIAEHIPIETLVMLTVVRKGVVRIEPVIESAEAIPLFPVYRVLPSDIPGLIKLVRA